MEIYWCRSNVFGLKSFERYSLPHTLALKLIQVQCQARMAEIRARKAEKRAKEAERTAQELLSVASTMRSRADTAEMKLRDQQRSSSSPDKPSSEHRVLEPSDDTWESIDL